MKTHLISGLIAATLATSALADHWNVERMNEAVNQTNFIVGRGCSGTLISTEYRLVLTNHHCITGNIRIRDKEFVENGVVMKKKVEELSEVVLSQKAYAGYKQVGAATWQSEIIARWKESDLALLQILADDIPQTIHAQVYGGEKVLRGQTVWTVGNPIGLDSTITKGIISSTTRTFRVPWADAEVPFIQVDAGIAGGNSGGALYDEHGYLIGVPAAASSQHAHLGLAIPFFRVQEFLTDNCYEDVWSVEPGVATHDECVKAKEDEGEKEDHAFNFGGPAISVTTADGTVAKSLLFTE